MKFIIFMVLLLTFYSYSNIKLAEQLFRTANLKIELYYTKYVYEDFEFSYDFLKEGLFLLIDSGKIYFEECQSNYKLIYFNKLKDINNLIERYINLLKEKHKKKIIKNWESIKKYIKG